MSEGRDKSKVRKKREPEPQATGKASDTRGRPRSGRAARGPTRRVRKGGPRVRSGAVRLDLPIARRVRAGHPWLYRETLGRVSEEWRTGDIVPVVDAEGYPVGAGLFEEEGGVALRMVDRDPDFSWSDAVVARRVAAAIERRAGTGEGCAQSRRLIHAEADGFPGLSVDRLKDHLLIYQYARCADRVLGMLTQALAERMGDVKGIYLQDRTKPVTPDERRQPARLLAGQPAPAEFTVEEDGLTFHVDITAPTSPGLFLDLREGRRWFEQLASERDVLNLFSFTGAFAVRAVRAGATSVTNVDAAARSHAKCRQNLAASGLDPEACEALSGDVFKYLERFSSRKESFDLVVVDPPPFSNVRGSVFSALRDWGALIESVAKVTAPGGLVMAVCNAARLSDGELLEAIGEGSRRADREVRLVGECGLPQDFPVLPAFPEGRYLKVKLLAFD